MSEGLTEYMKKEAWSIGTTGILSAVELAVDTEAHLENFQWNIGPRAPFETTAY